MKGTVMTRERQCFSTGIAGNATLADFAAELTEAAFPVALRHGVGTDWLDRKLELWNAITRTVNGWEQHARQHLSR
jgi:hypothetical protein